MRKSTLYAIAFTFGVAASGAGPAHAAQQKELDAALPSAESLLARVEAAIGDADARAKATNVVMVGTVTSAMLPGGGTVEELYTATKAKTATTLQGFGTLTTGATGDYSWSADPSLGITIRVGDEQGNVLRLFALARRAPWTSVYASAKSEARVDEGGVKCVKLAMTPKVGKQGEVDHWYVDEKSAALVRVDTTIPDPMGGDEEVVHRFGDWKAVDGVVHPHVHKLTLGPVELVTTFTKITHEAIADERLAPSAEVVAAAAKAARAKSSKGGDASGAAPTKPKIPEKAGEYLLDEAKEQAVASVRATVPDTEVKLQIQQMVAESMQAILASGATAAGPFFARFHSHEGGKVDLEAGLPFGGKFVESGRVKSSKLPAAKVASTWHFGDYSGLPAARAALENWMKEQKLSKAGGPWELFWSDPTVDADPSKWKTQILWPVK